MPTGKLMGMQELMQQSPFTLTSMHQYKIILG